MRIMALDVGTKRIGVAFSDELFITAQGAETIICGNPSDDIKKIVKIASENSVQEIVVGLPLNMDGTSGKKAEEVMEFVGRLSKDSQLTVKTWDERLTSIQADRVLLEADMSRKKRRTLSDKLAAQFILQSYLDSRRPDASA